MLREAVKRAAVRAARARVGKDFIHAAVLADERVRFSAVRRWPAEIDGFEDLAFLFASNQLNHGIASLQFDEAAHLFRLARRLGNGATVAEIGRYKGGSTFVIASAMPAAAALWSYDVHVGTGPYAAGAELDRELAAALRRYGLDGRVRLIVGDSRTAEAPPRPCDLVFVDGDHSYAGALADYRRWREHVQPGGHLLFHDAVETGGYGNVYPGVARVVREIDRGDPEFERVAGAGSIAHFTRTR